MKMHSPTLMMNVRKYFWGSLAIASPTVTSVPTRQNIRAMMIDAAQSELVCRPAHALQALYKGMILAHPALWTAVHEEDLSTLLYMQI